MKRTICDNFFEKSYKKFIKSISYFNKKSTFQTWLFETLVSFLWLKKYNNNEFFDFQKEAVFLIKFIFEKDKSDFNKKDIIFINFYNLCEKFYQLNSKYLEFPSIQNILIRNEILKNIIIFVKTNFGENIDFIINKFIKKT